MVDAKRAKATRPRKRAKRSPGEEIQRGKYVYLDPLKSPYWQMDFLLYGEPHRKSTKLTDRRKAERFAREHRDAAIDAHVRIHGKRGVPDRPRDGRLDVVCDAYWARDAHKDAGAGDTKLRLKNIVQAIGGATKLSEIDDVRVLDMIAAFEKRDNRSDPTKGKWSDDRVDAHVKTLRRVMNDAVSVLKFRLPDMPNWTALTLSDVARTRELSIDEVDAVFKAWRPDTRPAARFLHESGLRRANGVELQWSQVSPDLTRITVKLKAPKSRRRKRRKLDERRLVKELPVTQAMREILVAQKGKHETAVFTFVSDLTWTDRYGNRFEEGRHYPLTANTFYRHWRNACAAVGLEDVRPHDFRRTRGSLVLRATGDITKAQKALIHSRVTTTAEHYAYVAPSETLDAMEKASAYEAAQRARRERRPTAETGALPATVAGISEDLRDSEDGKGETPWEAKGSSSPASIRSPSSMPGNDNDPGSKGPPLSVRRKRGFRSLDPVAALVLADGQFQEKAPKQTVREAISGTFSELAPPLGGIDAGALGAGEVVTHRGVRGRFKEIQRRVACRLDEAFEPTPMERLRKAGHTVWAFEPEDGSASDTVVVVGDRGRVAVRAGAA